MQAVNYPTTTLTAPARDTAEPIRLEPPATSRGHGRSRQIAIFGAFAIALTLAGFLLGRLLIGPPGSSLPAGLGGFAEMYVSTLLTQAGEGAEEVLIPYLGYSPDLAGHQPRTWYVSHTAVWSIAESGTDRWNVLVAAAQLGLEEGAYAPAGTSFYSVEIELTPTGLRATALPSLAKTPLPFTPASPPAPPTDPQLTDAVTGFLAARFVGAHGTPFERVMVRTIRTEATDGDRLEISVDFLGVDGAGRATPLSHRLEVSTIDWSVAGAKNPEVNPGSS